MNTATPYLRTVTSGVELSIKVVPGSSRDRVAGPLGDALKIQVSAPPEKGKANAAVIALLSDVLGIPEKQVQLIKGESSPRKTLLVSGLDVPTIRSRLSQK